MSLLAKLSGSQSKTPRTDEQPPAASRPDPAPCSACGCHLLWRDRSAVRDPAAPWRCFHCCPPLSESMVAEWCDARAAVPAGSPGQDLPAGAAADDDGRWDCFTLSDAAGQTWDVVRRLGRGSANARAACPRGTLLSDWVLTLPEKLLAEW